MQTFEIAIFLQFFLGLVAAVNPVGIMPVFVSLTGHMTQEEKHKTDAQRDSVASDEFSSEKSDVFNYRIHDGS